VGWTTVRVIECVCESDCVCECGCGDRLCRQTTTRKCILASTLSSLAIKENKRRTLKMANKTTAINEIKVISFWQSRKSSASVSAVKNDSLAPQQQKQQQTKHTHANKHTYTHRYSYTLTHANADALSHTHAHASRTKGKQMARSVVHLRSLWLWSLRERRTIRKRANVQIVCAPPQMIVTVCMCILFVFVCGPAGRSLLSNVVALLR